MKKKILSIILISIILYTNYVFAYSKDNGTELRKNASIIGNNTVLDSKYSAVSNVNSKDINDLDYSEPIDSSNIVVEKAIECHRYLRENGYTYGGGYYIPDGIYNSSKIVDCSAYVSWVLYEIGCSSFEAYQEIDFISNCAAGMHPELEEIKNKRDVQPGDILVYRSYGGYSGHVELAAQVENGTVIRVYNCGGNYSISSAGTSEYPETSNPARDIAGYDSNKIYRVKNSVKEITKEYRKDILYDYLRIRNNSEIYLYDTGKIKSSKYITNGHYKTIEVDDVIKLPNGIKISNSSNEKIFNEYGVTAEQLKKYNRADMEFTELSTEVLEEIFDRLVDNIRENTKSKIDSNILKELTNDQINALSSIVFRYGNIGNFNEVYNLYKEGKDDEFINDFKISNQTYFNKDEIGQADWKIFKNGNYSFDDVELNAEQYNGYTVVSLEKNNNEVFYNEQKQFYIKDKINTQEKIRDRYCTIKISQDDGKEIDLSKDNFYIKYCNAVNYNGKKYNLKLNINSIKRDIQEDSEIYFKIGKYNEKNKPLIFNPGIGTSKVNGNIEIDISINIEDNEGNNPEKFNGTLCVSDINSSRGLAIKCDNPDNEILMENNTSKIKYINIGETSVSKKIENFDDFLFIGDSGISAGAEGLVSDLGKDIKILAIGGSRPRDWKIAKTAGGTYYINSSVSSCADYVTFPKKNEVKGISITLGANGLSSEISSMKELLDNLLNMYPGIPIFVNSVLYVGPRYTYFDYREFNEEVDEFNNAIEPYCNSKENLYYLDVSTGLYKDGAFNSAYGDDQDLEFNTEGNSIFVRNIREGILNTDLGKTIVKSDKNMFIYGDSDNGGEIYIKKQNSNETPMSFTFDTKEGISEFCYMNLTKQYNKITTSVENGTISPSDNCVRKGKDKVIQYKPDTSANSEVEYYLKEIKIDNNNIDISDENENSYTYKNVNADHSIEVIFARKYVIRFNSNGGNEIGYEIIKPGEKIEIQEIERRGYEFIGWYTDSDLKNRYDSSNNINSDITLYAGWKINEYNINYNLDGGQNNSDNPSKYTVEDEIIFKQPIKEGYEFKGWYENEELTKQINSINKGNIGDKEIYAKWIRKEEPKDNPKDNPENEDEKAKYKVEYYLENKEGKYEKNESLTETFEDNIGKNVTANTKIFEGYEENEKHSERVSSGEIKKDGSLILKLYYDRVKYKVSFDELGGQEAKEGDLKTQEVKYDTNVKKPMNPIKRGYEFEYWYYEEDGKEIKYDFEKGVTNDIKLLAKWKVKRYDINYELDEGVNDIDNPDVYTVEKEEKFKEPTREGYEFKGWYEDKEYTKKIESTKNKIGDITVYAKWESIKKQNNNSNSSNENTNKDYSKNLNLTDTTVSNKILPNTGILQGIIIGTFIIILIAFFGIRYLKLKNIIK